MFRKIKVFIVFLIVVVVLLGIWRLSSFIISKSYDSSEIVREETYAEVPITTIEDEMNSLEETKTEVEGENNNLDNQKTNLETENTELETYETEIVTGNHGEVVRYKTSDMEYTALLTVNSLLSEDDSPYVGIIDSADYEVKKDDESIIIRYMLSDYDLYVRCNFEDGVPYEFIKTCQFTESEDEYFSYLGSGMKISYGSTYSWRFE